MRTVPDTDSFSSVDVLAIADLDDMHNQHSILNCIKDAKAALADSVALEARQFQRARRSWIVG